LGSFEKFLDVFSRQEKTKRALPPFFPLLIFVVSCFPTVEVHTKDVKEIADIERSGYNFTDGCDFISTQLAVEVSQS